MGRRWWGGGGNWGMKKKNRSWRRDWDSYSLGRRVDLSALGIGSSSQPTQSQSVPSFSQEVVIDAGDDDDVMGHDELDDEVYFGQLRGNIVGIQYYRGTVNNKEMVALVREPHNPYDSNAIKVNNVDAVQVGHIKRELAKPLAFIVDRGLARLEGIVPFGQTNVYSMPVDITLWGKPAGQAPAVAKLKQCGYYLTGGTPIGERGVSSSQGPSSSQGGSNHVVMYAEPRRTYLTPAEVKNELDKLFENIKEGDKTSTADPAQAIITPLYSHQKQALNWMIKQENSQTLPPFWEMKNGQYFNTVLNYQRKDRPDSVKGGILADDMGLGKTLEMIALIVTNFVDGKPLAVPIEGLMRQRKSLQDLTHKAKYNHSHQSKEDYYIEEPVKVKKRMSALPELPSLPDDDNVSTPDISDDGTSSQPTQSQSVPSFSQVVVIDAGDDDDMMGHDELDDEVYFGQLRGNIVGIQYYRGTVLSLTGSYFIFRASKRPVRYTYSSEEDELINEETPKKKAKPMKDKGKAPVKSKGQRRGSKSVSAVDTSELPVENVTAVARTEMKGEDKENHNKKSYSGAEFQAMAQGKVEQNTGTAEKGKADIMKEVEPLPDLHVPEPEPGVPTIVPDYTKPGEADCSVATGRTPSKGPRATLIVCPLSVLSNWLDQFEMHVSPFVHLNIYLYYGANREKNSNVIAQQDIVLTTYSTLANDAKAKGARSPLKKVQWLRIVLDEGHAIKNPNSQQSKAICELQAVRKWVLTGTPIQNSMKDLWSLINFLKINPFTDKQWWRRTIERPLEKGDKTALVRVQHLMCNIAMRRTKTQTVNGKPIVELPKREVYVEHVKLSQEEKTMYEAMQNDGKLIVSKYFKQGTLLHNYGDVLAILLRLRQLCCHPFLIAKAAEAVKETLGEIEKNGGAITDELRDKLIGRLVMVLGSGTDEECAICLDALNVPVITHCAHVYCRPCIESVIKNERPTPRCPLCRGSIEIDKLLEVPPEELNGEESDSKNITSENWKSSAKCDALMNALLKLRSEDDSVKSIVVSQFTSLLTLLEIPLRANGFNFVRFDGSMTTKARTEAIEAFSSTSPNSPTIFLMSLKAGGVGINLTAASRVFLIDPGWNPASEDQCFDRCHRLGQTKDVVITKFVVEDSVEERMIELQDKKRQLMMGAFGQKLTGEQKRQARIKDIKCLLDL